MIVRRDGTPVETTEVASGVAGWLYRPGNRLLPLVIRHWLSRVVAAVARTNLSRRRIAPFACVHGIELPNPHPYRSFADFFNRDWSTPPLVGDGLVSPADAKLTVVPVSGGTLEVKGATYTVAELLGDAEVASQFTDGTALVFRLTLDEVHRYLFIDDGVLVRDGHVPGLLHTVGPSSVGLQVLSHNERRWQLLRTEHLGEVVTCQVGALLVGSIRIHDVRHFVRGQEQGSFALGGSTIVLLVGSQVRVDDDILRQNAAGHEVLVRAGERIGGVR